MVNRTDRHTKRPIRQKKNHHRETLKAMWARSADMPAPPEHFEVDKYYRIKLKRAVLPKDHSKYLRPQQEVIVLGRVANEIAEHISSAQAV